MNYGKVHSLEKDGELNILKQVKSDLDHQKEIIVFDVGANLGDYAEMILQVFNRNGLQLFAFEPAKDTFDRLNERMTERPIKLNNFGFSDKDEILKLYTSELGSDYASLYQSDKSNTHQSIQLKTIDGFCAENNIDLIDFIKIDVEGHELKCLLGAKNLLSQKAIKVIQFEFGISNIYSKVTFKEIYDFLTSYNYKICRVLKNGLVPIYKYHHSLEVYYTTNYIARV